MLQQILLLTIPTISTKPMVLTTIPSLNMPGQEVSAKLCATRTANLILFGSIVKIKTSYILKMLQILKIVDLLLPPKPSSAILFLTVAYKTTWRSPTAATCSKFHPGALSG